MNIHLYGEMIDFGLYLTDFKVIKLCGIDTHLAIYPLTFNKYNLFNLLYMNFKCCQNK